MSFKPLGDIVTVKGGKRLPKGQQLQTAPNTHPYIRVRDMGQRFIPRNGLEYISDEVFLKISRYIVNTNDVIISIVGTIGLVSVIDDFFDNASQTENCAKLTRLDRNDALYLYYYLISEMGQEEIRVGTVGAVQAKLPLYNIEKINVFWPERNIRKQIVNQLSTLDSKIELNQQTNQTLEAIAQAIFKSWFVDFDPVKAKMAAKEKWLSNHSPLEGKSKNASKAQHDSVGSHPLERENDLEEAMNLAAMSVISSKSTEELMELKQNNSDAYAQLAKTAALFPSAMQASELGDIPEGWRVKSFGEVSKCYDSKRIPLSKKEREKKKLGLIPYYGATSIMDYVNEWIFDDIYLLLGEDGSVAKEDGSPFIQYIWGKAWVNNHAHVLQGINGISTEQLMIFIQNQNIEAYVTGAVQLKLSQGNMNSIPFLKAGNDLNTNFQKSIISLYDKIRYSHDQSFSLIKLRDALLPRLLLGDFMAEGNL